MINPNLFSKYKKEYQEFRSFEAYPNTKQLPLNKAANLLFFEGCGEDTFLIIPSIFNSHEILTLGAPHDIVTHLRNRGSVYILQWLEIKDKNFSLEDYALTASQALSAIANKLHTHLDNNLNSKNKIHLIGHCLGGNLAVAASLIHQSYVNSLILLTTPWDFRHLAAPKAMYDSLGLAKSVEGSDFIPAIYMQILFFLLTPESFEQKLNFYQANHGDRAFFSVERWQFSGHAIPRKSYDQLMNEWIEGKIFKNKIMNITINPEKLAMPLMMVFCRKDRLVPPSSWHSLKEMGEFFEYNTGHIGYLVGSKRKKFIEDLIEWLE